MMPSVTHQEGELIWRNGDRAGAEAGTGASKLVRETPSHNDTFVQLGGVEAKQVV